MKDLMQMNHPTLLEVFFSGSLVGNLALSQRGEIWFDYSPLWVKSGFGLSPMSQFNLKLGPFKSNNQNLFNGLHGVFNDALPDGWGMLLMDRTLKKQFGWDPHEITPIDRLAYMSNRAMGGLEFRPAMPSSLDSSIPSLEELARDVMLVEEGTQEEVINSLAIFGGSPGGARPKVTIAMHKRDNHCISGFGDIPAEFDHWIIKFRTINLDPDCMGRIELAYSKMAQNAKIEMPPIKLIQVKLRNKMEDYFAVQRFDRVGNIKRHVISLAGMLEISHRSPSIDYLNLLKAVYFATKDHGEVKRAFRLMVFNVLAHNKDDHAKNFSFIHKNNSWKLAPAYDLTFSSGMNNQHTTAVSGEGLPTLRAIQEIAKELTISDWKEIVLEVYEAVSSWEKLACELMIPQKYISQYKKAMQSAPCFSEIAKQHPLSEI
jgi:serine/threonine-protein kinase HipA